MQHTYVLGIDVGTGSARAAVFDVNGTRLATASRAITMWRPEPDFVEQSSEDIWQACCASVRQAVQKAGIDASAIKGIGFDATCSLVVLSGDKPVSVTPGCNDEQNIIVWMDHRAKKEAQFINEQGHEVLRYVGGVISPEMQSPKLLWLKKHHRQTWQKADKFFDLPDFLVYRATGEDVRSVCTTTCKWTYLAHEPAGNSESMGRWNADFFHQIGLQELVDEDFARIGQRIRPIGEPVGKGLTAEAARDLGLKEGTPVGVSIIDAHAGGLGLLGMQAGHEGALGSDSSGSGAGLQDAGAPASGAFRPEKTIALIGGTSSCHMAVSKEPVFIDGVWGPYYSAMMPDYWLNEGGQSATGALIDHIIFSSAQAQELEQLADREGKTVYELLNERLKSLADKQGLTNVGYLTRNLHMLPYFHGNRSPRADASLTGGLSGLKLSSTADDLALLYLSAVQSIAYGTRHIIEAMNEKGYAINRIHATGGGTKNELFLQQHADICQCEIVLAREQEAVLLGSAVLGAVAAGVYTSVSQAMQQMNHAGSIVAPAADPKLLRYHAAKYTVFHKMYEDQVSYTEIMAR